MPEAGLSGVGLSEVGREWGRIGCIGFGGPPAHIALLRRLCVEQREWLTEPEFTDALAACNLLPGPASTQLAIYCAWRVRGRVGALVGGLAFILPGLIVILLLAALFLGSPPTWVRGLGLGAGSAVAAVAVTADWSLLVPSWRRTNSEPPAAARVLTPLRIRWGAYLLAGGAAAATIGPWLVLVLLGCGGCELLVRRIPLRVSGGAPALMLVKASAGAGVLLPVAWTALKVGALSFGGGFVIIPLMQADAVHHGWMTSSQFLNAVALGQITPGPVVQTVAVVGYSAGRLAGGLAGGIGAGLLASAVAFAPSFCFVLIGGPRFGGLRADARAQAFLDGAGPAAIGAIMGSAIPLAAALHAPWQFGVLGGAAILMLIFRRGPVLTLGLAALAGLLAVS